MSEDCHSSNNLPPTPPGTDYEMGEEEGGFFTRPLPPVEFRQEVLGQDNPYFTQDDDSFLRALKIKGVNER